MIPRSLCIVAMLVILPSKAFGDEISRALEKASGSVVSVLVEVTESSEKAKEKTETPASKKKRVSASGVILDKYGYIVTSASLFSQREKKVVVVLANGVTAELRFVGLDTPSNIALFKLTDKVERLEYASLAEVKRIAEPVIAIGRSAELGAIVTSGIVSSISKGRSNEMPFIQSTVALTPQMSGGPLVNMRGEVVGLNFAIVSASGAPLQVSFALPISAVSEVVENLKENEKSADRIP